MVDHQKQHVVFIILHRFVISRETGVSISYYIVNVLPAMSKYAVNLQ